MASDDKSSLQGLEVLLNEFFTVTSNDRKREIENVLNSFLQQNGAWRSCVFFLNNTKNHYVLMYALSVFEHLVNKRWSGIPQTEKLEVRHLLSFYLMNNHQNLPVFVKNKLIKVLVDIGRQDWPHFYPDFFTNILEVLHQPTTTNLGLIMLRTTSEELVAPSEDLSVQRKEELHKLLLNQVPGLLTMLGTFLENILEKHRRIVSTATPPPSPTHGEPSQSISPRGESDLDLFSMSPPQANNNRHSPLISRLLNQSNKTNLNNPLPPLDPDSEELSSLALACLAHLFSWMPLSAHITPSLLATVFCFAEFGCDVLTSSSGMTTAGSSTQLGVLAMDCVNEILSKNCVPAEFEEFLLRLFQQTFHLLQRITKDSSVQNTGHKLLELDERYIEKFTEFLRLFVSVHLRRVEANLHFPVIEFMSLILKYTIRQPDNEVFFSCLDIWMTFLDYLSSKMLDSKENHVTDTVHPAVQRYRDILVLLLTEILKKIQFTYNQTELDGLDNEQLNEDSETEWQRFLRHSLEVVAKVAELLPNDAFSILFPLFVEYSEAFVGLRGAMVKTSQGCELNVLSETECRRIHCMSRDLTTIQRIFGRLAGHFIGETHFQSRFDDGLSVVKRLCDLALYNTEMRTFNVKSQVASVLSSDFREVAGETLASLQVYCHWLSLLQPYSHVHKQYENEFVSIISSCIDAIIPLLHEEVPERVLLPASHFLVSLTTTVRPSFFIALETVQKLYHEVTAGKLRRTAVEIETLIFRALSNALVLPWPNQPDDKQDWPSRSNNHDNLIKALTINYQQMAEHTNVEKRFHGEAKCFIGRTLAILKDLIDAVSGEATKSKTIVYKSVQESLHTTLTLFPVYIHEPDVVDSILGFLLAVFGAFQLQLGVAYTEQIIHRLLGMFTQEQLQETISQEMSAGSRVLEKFLRILRLLAQQTGSSFKTLLPNIINFCLDQIHPLIAERSAPDIKTEFFELLHQLLLNNWRYFFRPNVRNQVTHGDDGICENQGQFVKMMEAFGQTFTQTDITVFKQNLQSLEDLNAKRKLYQKPIFNDGMLFHFLNVLLQVLVRRSHDLLQEEIAIALYNMASADFDKFYLRFLPEFLTGCEGLYAEQKAELSKSFKMDKDLPSFTRAVHRFVSDVRYYRLYNSSLPSGTVTF